MRRAKTTTSISLFPFLAVLLCAMGALIFLLIVLTRQIRDDAIAKAAPLPAVASVPTLVEPPLDAAQSDEPQSDEPAWFVPEPEPLEIVRVPVQLTPPPPLPPAPDPDEPLRAQLATLAAQQSTASGAVARLLAAQGEKQTAVEAARQEVAAYRFDQEARGQRLAAREVGLRHKAAERDELAAAVRDGKQKLAAVKLAASSAEPKISILPYDGVYGTPRRPILLECTGDSIRFLPENLVLSPADLDGFLPNYNPLLAGAAALRAYWLVHDPSAGKPYVLLIVRPDGTAAYYAARTLLQSLGADTGYELLTADKQLAQPVADPAATAAARAAIEALLRDRAQIIAGIAARAGTGTNAPVKLSRGRFDVSDDYHDPTAEPESRWDRRKSLADGGSTGFAGGGAGQFPPPAPPAEDGTLSSFRAANPLPGDVQAGSVPAGGAQAAAPPAGGVRWSEPRRLDETLDAKSFDPQPFDPKTFDADSLTATGPAAPPAQSFDEALRNRREMAEGGASRSSRAANPQASGKTDGLREPPEFASELERESATEFPNFRAMKNERRAGQRWGQGSPTAIIAVQKDIAAEIDTGGLTIGSQPPILWGEEGVTVQTLTAVYAAVEKEVNGWGEPPHNFYWSPRLRVVVRPGGVRHYDLLKPRLAKANLPAVSLLQFDPTPPPLFDLNATDERADYRGHD